MRAQRKLTALIRKLDAAYEALNSFSMDDDFYEVLSDMRLLDDDLYIEDAMNALGSILNVVEKYVDTRGSKSAGEPRVRDADGWPRKGE
jgi:hypothetical protein